MSIIPANCPNCKGHIDMPRNKPSIKCPSCGFEVHSMNAILPDSPDQEIEALLGEIQLEYDKRNYYGAYDKAKMLLNRYPDVPYGWLYRGWSSGQIALTSSSGITEMTKCLQYAVNIGLSEKDIPKICLHTANVVNFYTQRVIQRLEKSFREVDDKQTDTLVIMPKNASLSESIGAGLGAGLAKGFFHGLDVKNAKKANGKSFIETIFPAVLESFQYLWSVHCSEGIVRFVYGTLGDIFQTSAMDERTKKECYKSIQVLISQMQKSFPGVPMPTGVLQ